MIDVSLLNNNQKDAVLSDDKYLRIIAGAGSGKTRVLTMRIAHLIEDEDVRPYKILAITFTNKAANEMKERIANMLVDNTKQPWISTIHSLCVRILREDIGVMGYPKSFTIMDADDQRTIVKHAIKDLELSNSGLTPANAIGYISNNKGAQISVERAKVLAGNDYEEKAKASVYEYYEKRQKELFALDFDDLIIWVVKIFEKFEDIRQKWQRHFEYILVDEFQDVDFLQYTLIKYLVGDSSSLYVVGDPDQTIYTWRGADVNIIMDFEKTFSPAKTVILNENYRSTSAILDAANALIVNNKNRMKKDLFTSKKSDEKITHYMAENEDVQAAWIAGKISELHAKGKKYSDIAILYRSNYLSRALEKSLVDHRIPYIIYGGIRFYERQEVKDLLSYLRMLTNADDLAFERIINVPKRGIGNTSVDKIRQEAARRNTSMYEIVKENTIISGKAKKTLESFVKMIENWRDQLNSETVDFSQLFNNILEESGYRLMLAQDTEKGQERSENLKTLLQDIKSHFQNNPDQSLDEYLQQISLYTDRDETLASEYIQLMTVHAAKGLEFDTVFVTDLNEGIFPNERAVVESNRGIEEERRLAYVAFTRAQNKLFLTEAGGFSFILQRVRSTSRFIREIEDVDIEEANSRSRNVINRNVVKRDQALPQTPRIVTSNAKPTDTKSTGGPIKKNDRVKHEKFGEGIVIKIQGGIADIAFAYPHGIKKIVATHPSLEKIKK